jgi:hypothetical protein
MKLLILAAGFAALLFAYNDNNVGTTDRSLHSFMCEWTECETDLYTSMPWPPAQVPPVHERKLDSAKTKTSSASERNDRSEKSKKKRYVAADLTAYLPVPAELAAPSVAPVVIEKKKTTTGKMSVASGLPRKTKSVISAPASALTSADVSAGWTAKVDPSYDGGKVEKRGKKNMAKARHHHLSPGVVRRHGHHIGGAQVCFFNACWG